MKKVITKIIWNWYVNKNGEQFQVSELGYLTATFEGMGNVKEIISLGRNKECRISFADGNYLIVNNVNQIFYKEEPDTDSHLPF